MSAALFGLSEFWRRLYLPVDQMTVTAQHPHRLAAPRAVKRFKQARKKALALRTQPGLAFGENTHR
jgi:hypothetical protein